MAAERGKMDIKEAIQNAMISTGRLSPQDRMEIDEITQEGDYARVSLLAYHGRQKKPFIYWNICVDMARELIHWDTSTFYHL